MTEDQRSDQHESFEVEDANSFTDSEGAENIPEDDMDEGILSRVLNQRSKKSTTVNNKVGSLFNSLKK